MSEELFTAAQTLRKEIDACWDNADWDVTAQRIETLITTQLSQAIAEAQSGTIEAAKSEIAKIPCHGNVNNPVMYERDARTALLSLSSEAIAAAQAARDKRIRAEARLNALQEAQDWFGDHATNHCEITQGERCDWCERIAAARKETP